jgi:DNA-binding NarL/FixJ family response regulator
MQNTIVSTKKSVKFHTSQERNMKITYPLATFIANHEVRQELQRAIVDSRQLAIVGEIPDLKPRTIKKLSFIHPSVVLVHVEGVQEFQQSTIHELKRTWPESKVIVFTDDEQDDLIRQSFQAGADGYLLKEKSMQHVHDAVVSYLQKGIPPVSTKVVSKLIGFLKKPIPTATGKQKLTEKQRSIASLLVEGQSYDEIASEMNMRLDAVRYHIKQIYSKYNIHKSTQLSKMMLG